MERNLQVHNVLVYRIWLACYFGFNSTLRQYLSLYRAVSKKRGHKIEITYTKNMSTMFAQYVEHPKRGFKSKMGESYTTTESTINGVGPHILTILPL